MSYFYTVTFRRHSAVLFAGALFSLASGCVVRDQVCVVSVTSNPSGASVDMNGISVGKTPCAVEVSLKREWVGYLHSKDGFAVSGSQRCEFTAYPPRNAGGSFQRKVISPSILRNGSKIHFDFGMATNRTHLEVNLNGN